MAFTWPVNAPITQRFATNPNSIQPNGHTGIDFGVNVGTPVRATGPGVIVFEGWATELSANNIWWIAPAYAGICIVIDHGNGILSLYAHLNESIYNEGVRVTQGQVIGSSGNTGLSTGPHLHFEILGWPLNPNNGFYGRLNPNIFVTGGNWSVITPAGGTVIPVKPNQRRVGATTVNQRKTPNTSAAVVRVIPANSLEEFTSYIYAETVKGINLWYKDAVGYAWAGGFTEQKTDGMTNITPKPVVAAKANQRYAGKDNINQRAQPNITSAVVRVIPANSLETFTGYVFGESVNGNKVWYKDAKGYAWSGGFTNSTTTGLPDANPVVVPANRRTSGAQTVNQRKLPNTTSEVVRIIPANSKEDFTQYVIGEKISNIDIWYKDALGYAWAGGFTEQKTDGMTKFVIPAVTPTPKPTPTPTPVPTPTPTPVPTPVESVAMLGIDISNHQKGISLSTMLSDFIIIKATEGVGWTDPEFITNLTKARATGKLVGFYHFARPLADAGNTAEAEAASFLQTVQQYLQTGDIVVLDWEAENQNNTVWAEKWLDLVAAATNSSPLIYMNLSAANNFEWAAVKAKYKLWLAQYLSTATQEGYGKPGLHGNVPGWSVAMWQYTSAGRIAPWTGDLDLNIFYGVKKDWLALGVKDSIVTPTPGPANEKAVLMALLEKAVDEYLNSKK